MKKHQIIILVFLIINLFSINLFSQGTNVGSVYVIKKIEFQEINRWYKNYIKRAIERAEKEGASLIILELDTPGGTVPDALAIKNLIINSAVPVVAFINKNALSAGALISLSTSEIYMSDGSVIGAATPVYLQNGEMKKAGEKELSAMKAAMRSSAERTGKNVKIAEAMVDETVVLTVKDDGINLDDKSLLTLSSDEALKTKIANYKANSIEEIIKLRNMSAETKIVSITENRYDSISKFLISPIVLMLFLAMGIIGIYIEIKTPGFGVGGAIGLIGFSLFFFAQISAGGATWIAPAIFILGAVLLMIELFVVPGFGITGILGITAMFASMFIAFGVSNIVQATTVIFLSLVISITLMIILAKYLPRSKLFSHIALEENTGGYKSSISYDEINGQEGVAHSFLRPAGIISINGKKYDAISNGDFIEKNSKVKVINIEGNKIVVKKI